MAADLPVAEVEGGTHPAHARIPCRKALDRPTVRTLSSDLTKWPNTAYVAMSSVSCDRLAACENFNRHLCNVGPFSTTTLWRVKRNNCPRMIGFFCLGSIVPQRPEQYSYKNRLLKIKKPVRGFYNVQLAPIDLERV